MALLIDKCLWRMEECMLRSPSSFSYTGIRVHASALEYKEPYDAEHFSQTVVIHDRIKGGREKGIDDIAPRLIAAQDPSKPPPF